MHTYMIDLCNVVGVNIVGACTQLGDIFEAYGVDAIIVHDLDELTVHLTFDVLDGDDCDFLINQIESAYNQTINQMRVRIVRRT